MLWVFVRITSPHEAILMSTHNIGFYEELTKNIVQLSSNTHLSYLFFWDHKIKIKQEVQTLTEEHDSQ